MTEQLGTETLDAVVIGGGPAGLSAATWLARHRCTTLVVDRGEHRNRWADAAHGYLGMDPMNPMVLIERAREQLGAYEEVELVEGSVTSAQPEGDEFVVQLEAGSARRARALVLATGVADVFPEIDGFFEHYGSQVFHCPTCDGYEARDREVLAIGWSKDLAGFARELQGWARSVTLLTDGHELEGGGDARAELAAVGVSIVEHPATHFLGPRGGLRGVRLADGAELPCDLAFFSIAHRPHHQLAVELGCEVVEAGCVVVDEGCRTSVAGVYAAGDLTPGVQLVQLAAAKGTTAGVTCANDLWARKGVI